MSRKARLPQSRRHIFIFDEDWDFLLTYYSRSGPTQMGVSVAIREIIHQKILSLKARQIRAIDAQPVQEEPQDAST